MAGLETRATVDVAVPADAAFAFIADAGNNPTWQKGMVSCAWMGDEPPITVGSRYRQHASFLGRAVHSVFAVTEYNDSDDGERVIAASTLAPEDGGVKGGFPITFRRSVTPTGQNTCQVRTLVTGDAGLFFVLAGPLMGWMVRRSIAGDYERLKVTLEG